MTSAELDELIQDFREFAGAEFPGFSDPSFRAGFLHAIGLLELRRNALLRVGK